MNDLDGFLELIVMGDEHAFGRWMRGAEPILRDSLCSFARVVDVEAILQESLLRVWQIAPKVQRDGKPNSLLRISLRITRNLAISEVRKERRLDYVDDAALERRIHEVQQCDPPRLADPMLREAIRQCEEKLPENPKKVLNARLACCSGDSDAVLAERLCMRKNTFLQNFTRARKFLLECLRAVGVELEQEMG